jgi:hypothetical protein
VDLEEFIVSYAGKIDSLYKRFLQFTQTPVSPLFLVCSFGKQHESRETHTCTNASLLLKYILYLYTKKQMVQVLSRFHFFHKV